MEDRVKKADVRTNYRRRNTSGNFDEAGNARAGLVEVKQRARARLWLHEAKWTIGCIYESFHSAAPDQLIVMNPIVSTRRIQSKGMLLKKKNSLYAGHKTSHVTSGAKE